MTRLATQDAAVGGSGRLGRRRRRRPLRRTANPRMVVTFSPAMLDTDSGARAVYHRIAKAAEQVCPNVSYSLLVSETVLKCRAQAISAAVGKIHNQRLAAIHAARRLGKRV